MKENRNGVYQVEANSRKEAREAVIKHLDSNSIHNNIIAVRALDGGYRVWTEASNKVYYINIRGSYGVETIDEAYTNWGARYLVGEYNLNGTGAYVSQRCTKEWKVCS